MQHRPDRGRPNCRRVSRPDLGKDAPRPEPKTPNLLDQLAAAGLLVRYPIRDRDDREVAACYDVTAAGLRALVGDVNGKPSNGHSARPASYAARYVGRWLCYW